MTQPGVIGGYEVQRVLGSGGMATVYAALQKQPRRTVAIKVLHGAAADPAQLRRFRQEIEILGRLRHPFIGQVYGAGVCDEDGRSLPYFVMEYIPGARTITDFCDHRSLGIRERVKLVIKVCAGVEHGHHQKVIHRDLKPGNILVDERGEPKIIDYGVARFAETEVHGARTRDVEPGRLIGTIQYMAPEQIDAVEHDLDARCDVYALGVILYKLLTGRHPYQLTGLTVFAAARLIREKVPEAPSALNPAIGRDLETIVLKALSKDRRDRYRSVGSLGRDLLRWLTHKPIHGRRAALWWRAALFLRRHRTEAAAAVIILAVVGGAALALAVQRHQLARPMERAERIVAPRPERVDPGEGGQVHDGPAAPLAETEPRFVRMPAPSRQLFHFGEGAGGLIADQSADDRLLVTWAPRRASDEGASDDDHAHRDAALSMIDAGRAEVVWDRRQAGSAFFSVRMARSGTRVVTVDVDATVAILDAATGEALRTMNAGLAECTACAVDREGRRAAVAGTDLTMRVLDLETGNQVLLRSNRGQVVAAAFTAAGDALIAVTARGDVLRWNRGAEGWLAIGEGEGRISGNVTAMYAANDGAHVVMLVDDEVWFSPIDDPASPVRRTSLLAYAVPRITTFCPSRGLLGIVYESVVHVIDVRDGYQACEPFERPDGRTPVAMTFMEGRTGAGDRFAQPDLWLVTVDASGSLMQSPIFLDP